MRLGPDTVPQGARLSLPGAILRSSPNGGPRRDGLRPHLIVLHYTAMASADAALARLCDPGAQVSAHYLIGRDGTLWQMVEERLRAWHAGTGSWMGQGDINSRSIGIELDNDGIAPFSEPLMATLEPLLGAIMGRWDILPEAVIGHSDMAPGRKFDPGPRFDWPRLARRGLCRAGGGGSASVQDFRLTARALGYAADVDDTTLLDALRRRWRPWGRGPLAPADLASLPGARD